jgi:hypothetical protein
MQDTPTGLEGILDIEPPVVPMFYGWESGGLPIIFILIAVVALLLVTAFLFWNRYFSTRGKAQRRLVALRNHFNRKLITHNKEQPIDNHPEVFRLSEILRDGLNLQQVSGLTPLPDRLGSHKDQWQAFVEHLSFARYSPSGYPSAQIDSLFEDAGFWLKHWPMEKNV